MEERKFETKYGYFNHTGNEFIIKDYKTPKPWVNVISNGNFGTVVSQTGGGFSWLTHSNLNRLTRWNQDLVSDEWGKYIILKDEETGEIWSPTFKPVNTELDFYECRHGIGYTKFISRYQDIEAGLTIFIPFGDDVELWELKISNLSNQPRTLSVYTYFEWCLGAAPDNHREFHKTFIETEFDSSLNAILAKKRIWEIPSENGHWNTNWPYKAFFSANTVMDSFDCHKDDFIGQYGTLSTAEAFQGKTLKGNSGKWNDSIASFQKSLKIERGDNVSLYFCLGAEKEKDEIRKRINTYNHEEGFHKAFDHTRDHWNQFLGKFELSTPDEGLNVIMNYWLKYQAISSRVWGRTGYYQQSGAYGFRDQLQDSQIFLYLDPSLTKKQILLHGEHQFSEGNVLHWWHPITDEGLDAGMSDDLLWLPFVVVSYLKETLDWDILNLEVPYYRSEEKDSILGHCLKAIDYSLSKFSERGLPLILKGDWNDGLSSIGMKGKGESIWLGEFIYYILKEFIQVLKKTDKGETLKYEERMMDLKKAINEYGWDGDWFWRASKDNGDLIGSKNAEEGKIFLNPQNWAVISGCSTQERYEKVMSSVKEYLEKDNGTILFYPAYTNPDEKIGYLSRYAPGVRENGGVYTHAATWTVWAASLLEDSEFAYRAFKKLNPIYNGMDPDKYVAEPYVTPGNIDGPDSERYGKGGWTWYTGSAAWLFRVGIDYLIGIEADYEGLRIKPCFPVQWEKVSVKRVFRNCEYQIDFKRMNDKEKQGLEILVDGKKITGSMIESIPGKRKSKVTVYIYH